MVSPNQNTTQMTNPPKAEAKLVKIKAIYPIRMKDEKGDEKVVTEGNIAFVTEDEAKEFCDKTFNIGHKISSDKPIRLITSIWL